MEATLEVGSTPSQDLVATNHVFVAPGTFAGIASQKTAYLMVPGEGRGTSDFVFIVRESAQIPAGTVGLNRMQRTCCKVSPTLDKVTTRLFTPPSSNFIMTTLTVEIDYAAVKKAPENPQFDITRYSGILKQVLVDQVLAVDQQIGIEVDGFMMRFMVMGVDILDEKSGLQEHSTHANSMCIPHRTMPTSPFNNNHSEGDALHGASAEGHRHFVQEAVGPQHAFHQRASWVWTTRWHVSDCSTHTQG